MHYNLDFSDNTKQTPELSDEWILEHGLIAAWQMKPLPKTPDYPVSSDNNGLRTMIAEVLNEELEQLKLDITNILAVVVQKQCETVLSEVERMLFLKMDMQKSDFATKAWNRLWHEVCSPSEWEKMEIEKDDFSQSDLPSDILGSPSVETGRHICAANSEAKDATVNVKLERVAPWNLENVTLLQILEEHIGTCSCYRMEVFDGEVTLCFEGIDFDDCGDTRSTYIGANCHNRWLPKGGALELSKPISDAIVEFFKGNDPERKVKITS